MHNVSCSGNGPSADHLSFICWSCPLHYCAGRVAKLKLDMGEVSGKPTVRDGVPSPFAYWSEVLYPWLL